MGRKSDLEKTATAQLEDLTEEIRKVSQMGKAIQDGRLTKRAISLLMWDMCGRKISRPDIEIILHNLPLLEKEYLK